MTAPVVPQERVEIKYLLDLPQGEPMAAWLDHVCVNDPAHPEGTISSIYFDTPRLALYERKASSDYIKVKVRLRWYDEDVANGGPAYLESKIKEGRVVRKRREKVTLARESLDNLSECEGLVEELRARAESLTGVPLGHLLPVCVVRYNRRRYLDGRTGSRVALDRTIRVYPADGNHFPVVDPVLLGVVVLEVKGSCAAGHFPHLFPGIGYAPLPSSFSKYAAGVEALQKGGLCGPAVPWRENNNSSKWSGRAKLPWAQKV